MERSVRSSLPSRVRQLLSGETTVGVSVRLDSDTPPEVKAFIDKVIQSPIQDIAIPLSGFHWEYDKGNFHHWRPLFLHFDTYFKAYLSCRSGLLLTDEIADDESSFPKHAVLQILRVMQIILENCPNKITFDGLEQHFKLLLSSTDPEVLIAALETLSALVKINPSKLHGSSKSVGCGSVNSYLLSLAQGWGSKEEGLGLYSCVVANERLQAEGLCLFPSEFDVENEKSQYWLGSTLYFELNGSTSKGKDTNSSITNSSSRIIHIPDLHLRKEDDLAIMRECIELYNVPPDRRFPLLTRIRYAHALRSARTCRLYSRICLLSFIVLVQSNDAHDELASFFSNEPEYTNELIRIVRSEESIPGTIRTLAILGLGAQLSAYISSNERARILSGSSPSFTATHRTILLNVLQKTILSLNNSNNPSSLAFVEALLQFYMLNIVSSSTSGNNLRGWGMLPTFLPLLEDADPGHMHLVCLAVKTIQKLLDYSSSAVPHFRELGGVEMLVQRLHVEVHRMIGLSGESDSLVVSGECSRINDDLSSSQKRLIRVLLKALGSATFASTNANRSPNSQDSTLATSLAYIFGHVGRFGGEIYHSAVTLMSEMIHKDPTCLSTLFEMGLPDAFLSSVVSGVLPSTKALTCVPNGLGAICLNNKGVEAVKETKALRFLVDTFTSKKYVVAMNEAIVPLATAVEELLRHVSSLRGEGVDIIVEVVDKISSFRESHGVETSEKLGVSTAMDMDPENRENECGRRLVSSADSAPEGVSDDQFLQLLVFHLMVLVHRSMENTETCRLFVEKSGIDALLKLLLRPSIAQSSKGMSIALHSTMVFKGFTQHHSAPLARAFCSALKEHLKKALAGFLSSGTFLLDPSRMSPDETIFSSLSLVEFLLFLATSKENRWVTALLAEFSNDSKDVVEDIGRIQCEVMWQISLLEDVKLEMEEEVSGSSAESQSDGSIYETEEQRFEQRFNTFRQFLDPLLRRRSSGWRVESQFFELMNLYRDIGRSTSFHQRLSSDGPSSIRSRPRLHSESSDAQGKKEIDKQRAYYSSCCDMIRSLSFHITHLFQELGKEMLLPSRRREDTVNMTPASKSVASTFASISLDHMNFGSNVSISGSQSSISAKCRYFGKVVDFIDGILMDRLDSCNPALLNCFYGHGVVQSVLTTFEATSQLLFTVNKAPSSPMETDDGVTKQDLEEADNLWLYGPLASYGKLMDHLVTSSFILSPSTKHLLSQPLISGDVPFPRDADTFVKVLHSMVLKAVLPVWTHPQFADCNNDFITTVISIIKHVFSGIEVKSSNSNMSSRITGPPPSEATISTIVEMGFSRLRTEEALRQVGSNSVELAMEWLFAHPEEVQEDDELARALAMSLGNSESETRESASDESSQRLEAEAVQLPAVEDLLSTCMRLLQIKESLAFPVHDLLMTIAFPNDGQYRSSIVTCIVEQMKSCGSVSDNKNSVVLSSLFHVLALTLNEDAAAREIALNNGLIDLAVNLLSKWDSDSANKEKNQVPKWVTAAFLAVDRMVQADHKLNAEILDQLKTDDASLQQNSVKIGDDTKTRLQSALGLSPNNINILEQKRLIEISCSYLRSQLPSETMHAVLQLCAALTRTHSVAISFLDAGGVGFLLSLPSRCLFPGFDSIAATIICHVLEDPQTLQQAMESEIKHSLVAAANRHSTGRVSARNFLVNLTSVISRDPVIFMLAAQSVCQIEMVGERPYIVLLKDCEKEKSKDQEKEKDREKQRTVDGKLSLENVNTTGQGTGQAKNTEANSKSPKAHRKYPQSFVTVIELLLDAVSSFEPPLLDEANQSFSSATDMDVDVAVAKGKGKAIMDASDESDTSIAEASTSIAKVGFILKLLTEIILMYATSVHVLLRKDADQRGCGTGIFYHVLRKFLPCAKVSKKDKKVDGDWRQKLSTRSSQFLVAPCVRSAEARRRVFSEINHLLNDFVDSLKSGRVTGSEVQVFVDLLNDILAARSPTGSYISGEASATFVDTGLVKSLTQILKVLDLDDSDSPKVVSGLIKALDLVSKEHFISAGSNVVKGERSVKVPDNDHSGRTDNNGEVPDVMEAAFQSNNGSGNIENVEPFNALHNYGGAEAVTNDMEHEQDFDGGSPPGSEDDYMHETSEEARRINNGIDSVSLQFEIQPHVQENIDEDDDEEMSGDDVDEVDEDDDEADDEDHNDLEEDEAHHLPHPDTDQDDQDIDDDDGFDEEVLEEDDEDDEDDEDEVILRLEEGINGINVLDHIEVLGRNHSFANETVRLMPVEAFGSRRQGRTTSIYDLLGRTGNSTVPSRHPLLTRSLQSSSNRQTGSVSNVVLSDRNIGGTSSRLDVIFRSLRSGRHGHRLNLWVDDNQRTSGSSAATIPQGLEELLLSHLRRPSLENPSSQTADTDIQNEVGISPHQNSEGGVTPDISVGGSTNRVGAVALNAPPGSANTDMDNAAREPHQSNGASGARTQAIEMQIKSNETVVRDVEAVSQESGGSGATLGESLRSLDVEIGSADGQDDGGERQGADRTSLGDQQSIRPRRAYTSTGTSTVNSARETPLLRVTEVPENSREAEEDGPSTAQQINSDTASGAIDPAFLDALPEELRAEVLSAQQGQVAQPATADPQNTGDIDPEFLAALPPDIRAEVLAQQQVQRLHQSQELEGQPVEMDTVSIIATFPAYLREEVLLTSSDAILANLTPALVAEANMLRERFAHRYHNRALFGMYPRSQRGESSRRGEGSGSGPERSGGGIGSRKSVGAKFVEVNGATLVDTEAVQAMIRILRVVQPLYKGQLQRLLLNLCSHGETRSVLVKVLMGMLMLDTRKPINHGDAVEPSFRLYACQNNVMYSRPQSVDGIPPLVSRRVLETMTYLARNHPFVARILLQLRLSQQVVPQSAEHERGKALACVGLNEDWHPDGHLPIELLLQLLNQPLYSRSVAHLEQLLSLLEVIIDNAESKHATPDKSGDSSMAPTVPQAASSDAEHIELESSSVMSAETTVMVDSGKTIPEKHEIDAQLVLASLPQAELRLLCSLLAKEGLSDNAYGLVAEVVKKLVVAAPSHGRLFITELANSVQTLTKSAMNELHVFSEAVQALLSMASLEGPSVLRVLQALSSLVTTLIEKKKEKQIEANLLKEYSAALSQVWVINSALDPLWLELSNCINKIESYSESTLNSVDSKASKTGQSGTMTPLPAGAQNVLPYVESFFVVAEKLHPAQAGSVQDSGAPSTSEMEDSNTTTDQLKSFGTSVKFDEKNAAFVRFSERHRKLLNAFIRQNPALLEKSFSLLLKVPRFIDFDNKRSHFRSKIKHQHDHHHVPLRISVRRAYILEDSYNQLRLRLNPDLKGRLTVHFQGEEGMDAGGLTREWYQLLSRVIFDKGALLFTTVGNESTFQPNPNSVYQTEHLSYFKFVGRVVGKALFDGQLLDVHFTRSFYKHILGVKVTYNDIEAIDPDFFKNLKWMLENDISDVLDLTFSIDADEEKLILYERTEVMDYELIPNGRNIKVTEVNKHQYVDLIAKHRLTTAIRPQINAFLEGFGELIPRDLISIFNDKELELLISGLPDIDLDDLRANTEYSGYSAASPVIQWFWEVVQGLSKEDKARLLQFVTGTSKVPLEGFSALQGISGSLKFQIHKAYGSPDHLPSAHTCFNQLDMPEYPSKEQLEERLLLAIHEGNEGFGFG